MGKSGMNGGRDASYPPRFPLCPTQGIQGGEETSRMRTGNWGKREGGDPGELPGGTGMIPRGRKRGGGPAEGTEGSTKWGSGRDRGQLMGREHEVCRGKAGMGGD